MCVYIYVPRQNGFVLKKKEACYIHTFNRSWVNDVHPRRDVKNVTWFVFFILYITSTHYILVNPKKLDLIFFFFFFLPFSSYEDPSDSASLTRSGLFSSPSLRKEPFLLLLLLGLFGSYLEEAKKLRANTTSDTTGLMLGCSCTHIAEIASAWYNPLTGYCPWSNGSTIFGKFLLSLNNGRACKENRTIWVLLRPQ